MAALANSFMKASPAAPRSVIPPALVLPADAPNLPAGVSPAIVWQEMCEGRKREKLMKEKIAQLTKELKSQNKTLTGLRKKVRWLGSKKYRDSLVRAAFLERFSEGRTNHLLHGNQRAWRWSEQDIVDSLVLHGYSRRGYKFLMKKKLLPLPGESTLRSWIRDFPCRAGVESDLLDILSSKLTGDLPEDYRDCILSFDQMPLRSSPVEHNPENGQASGAGAKKLQLVVLRGLFHEWRTPVFYDFDTLINKTLLLEIISAAESRGARVRGVAGILINHSLMKDLNLTPSKPFAAHPSDPDKKVYFFPDVAFLLKVLRNRLLMPGVEWPDGTEISKKDLEPLLLVDGVSDVMFHPKLTREHLDFFGQVTVKLAAQLLSHTTATVMRERFPKKACQAAFIELADSW